VCKQAQYCGNEMRNGGNGAKSSDILWEIMWLRQAVRILSYSIGLCRMPQQRPA
jgi:hypothetical protein